MDLTIRADATRRIGIGHVMRCLALAEEWLDRGLGRVFLHGCIESDALIGLLEEKGIVHVPMTWEDYEAASLLAGLNMESGWIVVDGYGFGGEYMEALGRSWPKTLYIDDFGRYDLSASIILNYNFYARETSVVSGSSARLLLGPSYALIRKEFQRMKPHGRPRDAGAGPCKCLVTIGGSDFDDLLLNILRALALTCKVEFDARIVLGPVGSWKRKELETIAMKCQRASFVEASFDMGRLMAWADMAITAGGSTCFELAYMKVPFLVCSIADNQDASVKWLLEHGYASPLFRSPGFDVAEISKSIAAFIEDAEKRRRLGMRLGRLVDGQGCKRVVDEMTCND